MLDFEFGSDLVGPSLFFFPYYYFFLKKFARKTPNKELIKSFPLFCLI